MFLSRIINEENLMVNRLVVFVIKFINEKVNLFVIEEDDDVVFVLKMSCVQIVVVIRIVLMIIDDVEIMVYYFLFILRGVFNLFLLKVLVWKMMILSCVCLVKFFGVGCQIRMKENDGFMRVFQMRQNWLLYFELI